MSTQRQAGKDMRLKITACRQVYSGANKRGDSYTIYEVDAVRPQDGVKINQKLRSFTALTIGQEIEVTVVPFSSEQHGRSFTLYPKNQRSGNTTERLNELTEQLEEAFDRITKLSSRVAALEGAAVTEGRAVRDDASPSDMKERAAANFGDDPGF